MKDERWQDLYDTLAHGDAEHREWLRGMIQGFASATEGHKVHIEDGDKS